MAKFGDLVSCGSKDILKNALSCVLILMASQIWQTMGWLKIQKLEYLENGTYLFYEIKKFLTCVSDIEKLLFSSGGNL